ncbi:MAG: 3-oxoacyl-[acyl-carrier-protein] reductase [Bacteroidales bacterium]|nr:3-oxoacyl-[acyl-carrier-protein] reductase [Bacteroidales bacterium]
MGLLDSKTAIVTGAARGIGRAIAITLAKEGANIAFTDIAEDDNFKSAEKELNDMGIKAKGYVSDASNFEQSQTLIDTIVKDFGAIHVLVNNAGITRDNLLMRMTEDQWDLVLKINLKSVFNMTKAASRPMMKQREGSIINVSSIVGVGGNAGQANYSASKAGMIGFSKSIAKELGSRNIRCNAVAPGFIMTAMTDQLPDEAKEGWYEKIPLKRGGTPEEVAKVILFLASDLSSYVSGQVINICGAMQT